MHAFHPESFDREIGCSEKEWLAWLPHAMGSHAYALVGNALTAPMATGQLRLSWRPVASAGPVTAASPRLRVSYRFSGLDALHRYRFMKNFDLFTQRGRR